MMFSSTDKSAKDRGFLRQVADAEARPAVHGQPRHIAAVDRDAPVIGGNKPRDHVEHGRLARAVRSEQAHGLPAADGEAHALHHLPLAVGLLDIDDGQPAFAADGGIDSLCIGVMPAMRFGVCV